MQSAAWRIFAQRLASAREWGQVLPSSAARSSGKPNVAICSPYCPPLFEQAGVPNLDIANGDEQVLQVLGVVCTEGIAAVATK